MTYYFMDISQVPKSASEEEILQMAREYGIAHTVNTPAMHPITTDVINVYIGLLPLQGQPVGQVSDGYHSFDELYALAGLPNPHIIPQHETTT